MGETRTKGKSSKVKVEEAEDEASKELPLTEALRRRFGIIGRESELRRCLAAKLAGKHILLEGDVGVGKTTLALAIAGFFRQPLYRIDGDEQYHSSRLTGHFEPPLVLEKGFCYDSFIPGPLTSSMKEDGILFINELNRLPEGTQNALLSAMDEGFMIIPKLGEIRSGPNFCVIATMNPREYVAVSPLSEAIRDRFVWVKLVHQSEVEERQIVFLRSHIRDRDVISSAVEITRATRNHPDLRRGSSVRGAIDIGSIMRQYKSRSIDIWIEVCIMALATKIEVEDGVERSVERIIEDIVRDILGRQKRENF
ncbi:MAG: AAA family ATPase [Candidatus Hodarchaeota archaeon]